ncbi:hypothetical protein BDW02DRAFT_81280 [Decorospora gaudefroyi]|uniref:SWI5-dependent HO expression protein 3 n=1 Tax=Decorospora gaudefroyi TaxID=184978 RepID=A0A6A5KL36_9PLEO|nr:hypothetical protein BDW02DRAFT_81280 [Decorospora gaudefroyi]
MLNFQRSNPALGVSCAPSNTLSMLAMQSGKHTMGRRTTPHISFPISSVVFTRASPFNPGIESHLAKANQNIQKLERRAHSLEQQRDTCAAYLLVMKDRPTIENYDKDVAARKSAEEKLAGLEADKAELRVILRGHEMIIADQQQALVYLRDKQERDTQALAQLRQKHRNDRKAVESWSFKVTELKGIRDGLEDTVENVREEKCELRLGFEHLSGMTAEKDKQLDNLKKAVDTAVKKAQEHELRMTGLQKELAEQQTSNRKLSGLFAEKKKTWEENEAELNRLALFAQNETRNNHGNWFQILEEKDT